DWPPAKKLVSIVTNVPPPETASRDFSALPAVGVFQYWQFGNRGGLLHELRTLDPRVARHGGARRQSRAIGRRSHRADRHGQGGGEPRGCVAARRGAAAPHNRSGRSPARAP